ncbi:orotate phosphoribosyltransferase [Patiriisocius marinistellae]|uniref:Orotate phosphoribosyltransferase n=1 Tax=Patiriisocius marinistellae TaxID=2494560 RepID=A0A5J4G2T2_9FLAO|nr:DUF4870 domain-containing protein [Patiriisocius marinistellae]GEQ87179.1 orotate phosphoribosyltransferase [Patiriisocius marinistellae]
MEVFNQTHKVEDRNLLVVTHLCQLLTYVTGFGGLIAPLVIWASKKESIVDMDLHGKQIINFQLSLIIYALISIPMILALGLGILMLIGVCILGFIMPIVNAINASNGELPNTFGTIPFLK